MRKYSVLSSISTRAANPRHVFVPVLFHFFLSNIDAVCAQSREVVEVEMLQKHMQTLMTMEGSGLLALVQRDQVEGALHHAVIPASLFFRAVLSVWVWYSGAV
jgi:hypothetical protein